MSQLTLKGSYGQNIFDIAISTHGDTENLVKLMKDNNINGANDQAIAQKVFTFDSTLIKDIVFFNSIAGKTIATSIKGTVFGEENQTTIFISEDGKTEFIAEK